MSRDQKQPVQQYAKNLGLAAVAGQAGFITLIIVFSALFLGLWLDSLMGWRGPLTCCSIVVSVPISMYVMMRIALNAVGRIQPRTRRTVQEETDDTMESSETEEV